MFEPNNLSSFLVQEVAAVHNLSLSLSLSPDSKVRPLVHYRDPDVRNTTVLLLSDNGSTLYVGGRDAILSLDVSQSDVITLKKKVSSGVQVKTMSSFSKSNSVDCPNFIRVLQQINSTHLYVCGSFAFGPRDGVIKLSRGPASCCPLLR
uniref:Sema domain-containing protein n=1 Tax=Cynoglossus semilaevis TaxID=244447 RepID=A0A3P8UF90_CYNSE